MFSRSVSVIDAPDPQKYFPFLRMRRTDPGYEDGPDEASPINPREWLEVHPAPPASAMPTT
ncbi:hypothetical protein [Streptomyces europaeiscabiei]|uniref:hypothetical protein n=1 Tax=Streptomyces europaeiscabiei TaxID=146819 RepID=UPI000E69AE24|nr:hypothetical protein [Streptomyces europaeiscabiei]